MESLFSQQYASTIQFLNENDLAKSGNESSDLEKRGLNDSNTSLPEDLKPTLVNQVLDQIRFKKHDASRAEHIDGLRLVAMFLIITATVVQGLPTFAKETYLSFLSSNLGWMLLLTILGYVYAFKNLTYSSNAQQSLPLSNLGFLLFARIFRFLVPTVIWSAIQLAACRGTNISPSQRTLELILGQSFPSDWCFENQQYIVHYGSQSWQYIVSLINALSMQPMEGRLTDQLGNLGKVPWLLQASFYTFTLVSILNLFPRSNRFIILFCAGILSFCTCSFLLPTTAGICLVEISRIIFVIPRYTRFAFQFFSLAFVVLFMVVKQIRTSVNNGMTHLQILNYPTLPQFQGYQDSIDFVDCLVPAFFLFFLQCCPFAQKMLSWQPLQWAGRNVANSVIVVHPLVLWYFVPHVKLDHIKSSATRIGIIWILSLFFSVLLSPLFRLLLELPSMVLGRYVSLCFFDSSIATPPIKSQSLPKEMIHQVNNDNKDVSSSIWDDGLLYPIELSESPYGIRESTSESRRSQSTIKCCKCRSSLSQAPSEGSDGGSPHIKDNDSLAKDSMERIDLDENEPRSPHQMYISPLSH